MKTHHLKTLQPYFASVADGNKTFELRRNDRDFRMGDTLILEEIDAQGQKTGETIERRVTHVLHSFTDKGDKALADGFCVMSIRPTGEAVTVGGDDTYTTKPVQAWRYTSLDNVPEWLGDIFDESTTGPFAMASGEGLSVGGLSIVRPGDWIIKDAGGYFSRCDDQKFAENYRHTLTVEAPSPSEREKKLEKAARDVCDQHYKLSLARRDLDMATAPSARERRSLRAAEAISALNSSVLQLRALLSDTEVE